jgi:release factor glutamine methyltransferase
MRLKLESIDTANIDSILLLSNLLGVSKEYLVINNQKILTESEYNDYLELIERRIKGEPVSKIVGRREFYGREFIVNRDVLDPRPDSELIIDTVKELFTNKEESLNFLDLGTGSGCLLITLLLEYKKSRGIGIDISEKAIAIAKKNSHLFSIKNRSSFILSDWIEAIDHSDFNVIVCNPPYIPETEINNLIVDVKSYDPIISLVGGCDGLINYKKIFSQLTKRKLNKKIILIFEIYSSNIDAIVKIIIDEGFDKNIIKIRQDLANKKRVIYMTL